ncbi:SDR family oxidoreductase [Micrococcus porci]|uniref:SDR family oxidoreductase n=1 Tax=Micrococcus porci TaxID=2856555 RepID=UPI003CF9531E
MDILIIGGHGKIALLTAPLLADAGHTVTSAIRNPEHADDVRTAGAEPLVLDVEHASPAELEAAMRGRDVVVWSAGAGGGDPERTYAVDRDAAIASMDAARAAGVRRYVMVSYRGASVHHGVPEDSSFFAYAEAKAAADEHLRGSHLDWTILGPGALTLDEPTGRVQVDPQGPSEELPGTSRGNVARMIAAAVDSGASIGRQVEFVDGDTPVDDAFRG